MCMTAVHPLDMVRGQMTTSPGLYPNWHSGLRTTYQRDGVRGLYKGGSHSAIWAAVYYGVQFFSYDTIKVGIVQAREESSMCIATRPHHNR